MFLFRRRAASKRKKNIILFSSFLSPSDFSSLFSSLKRLEGAKNHLVCIRRPAASSTPPSGFVFERIHFFHFPFPVRPIVILHATRGQQRAQRYRLRIQSGMDDFDGSARGRGLKDVLVQKRRDHGGTPEPTDGVELVLLEPRFYRLGRHGREVVSREKVTRRKRNVEPSFVVPLSLSLSLLYFCALLYKYYYITLNLAHLTESFS